MSGESTRPAERASQVGQLASIGHRDRDLYARERVLNSAILAADISSGWEEY
jgi:hypothetical protein